MNKELLALSSEIEALTKPSREMDARIALASGWRPRLTKSQIKHGFTYEQDSVEKGTFELTSRDGMPCGKCKYVPKYTASLDAAYSLIPEGFRPYQLTYHPVSAADNWLYFFDFTHKANLSSLANTHCGAVIAASLRAIASEIETKK